jgi:hemerythrin
LAEHRAMHEALKAQVFEHRSNLGSRTDLLLASEMLSFLKDWLLQHIMVDDKQACKYLLDRAGVGEAL